MDELLYSFFMKNGCLVQTHKKNILMYQGEIAENIYYVKDGILRLFHIDEKGRDITVQFFCKDSIVSSFESLYLCIPSEFSVDVIKEGYIYKIKKEDLFNIVSEHNELQSEMLHYICHRFINYTNLFLSRIKNTPEERYIELSKIYPKLLNDIPHHYIASYLGITPVSFSRIKNRVNINNC